MKTTLLLAFVALFAGASNLCSQPADAPVDFDKARQLFEKRKGGAILTPEETAYMEKAKAVHEAQMHKEGGRPGADGIDWQKAQDLYQREKGGEKLSEADQKYLDHAKEVRQRGGHRATTRCSGPCSTNEGS